MIDDHARALADALEAALPRWVESSVVRLHEAWTGSVPDEVRADARAAGRAAAAETGAEVRRLLESDIDAQPTTPLTILRHAVAFPTAVLRRAGVPEVERDRFRQERFPDDPYDLAPASFADIDPDLHELGLRWGAAKAHEHLRRRGGRGGRD